jgi:hypothetical protein
MCFFLFQRFYLVLGCEFCRLELYEILSFIVRESFSNQRLVYILRSTLVTE